MCVCCYYYEINNLLKSTFQKESVCDLYYQIGGVFFHEKEYKPEDMTKRLFKIQQTF